MNHNDSLAHAVRLLDPADPSVDPRAERAQSLLDTILAVDPTAPRRPTTVTAGNVVQQRGFTGRGLRFALLGTAATLVAAALVLTPALTGGDKAFATWMATPASVATQEQRDAAEACLKHQSDGAGSDYAADLAGASLVIAEARGAWTTVLLAGDGGFTALCITDQSAPLFSQSWIGSVGFADVAPPGARQLVATDLGVGTVESNDISMIVGEAGTEVSGVTYASRTHGTVTATVSHGHFALWFPGDELIRASSGVDVDVTFTDGTSQTLRLSL